jgi:CubicO group peptidase (beta-lactamase class C family)
MVFLFRMFVLLVLAGFVAHAAEPQKIPAPYPPSPVIKGIAWAPKSEIIRLARGSDNWPTAWAEDGSLFTAYGDGNGFEPFMPRKLSLGIAQVFGKPPNVRGANIPTVPEFLGDGARGYKASGLTIVGGTLYLWRRNLGPSMLLESRDRGKTWTDAACAFEEGFGCPTFLSFGADGSGVQGDYIYVYSSDSASAYDPADRMVLARVPREKLKERSAYEFFRSLDGAGNVRWAREIRERGAVFSFPGHCYRSGITYAPVLKRYLWCQTLPESKHPQGPRFQGGFGIYDAPEPWGPWSTVFFTTDWDVGPGETSSFPPAWMSEDGRTLYLLFSGDDCFSVRKATLSLATEGANFEWGTASPERAGFSAERLDALRDELAAHSTKAFLLVRDDKIVYEWYAPGHSATIKHGAASMSKALLGGVAVAVGLTDGILSLDDPASKFIPEWRTDSGKSRITIRQLGSHTSGLDDAEEAGKPHDQLTGWKGDFWKRLAPPRDPFTLARDVTPMRFAPGDARLYSNPGIAMLNYATTAALRSSAQKDIRMLLRDRVMRPIGIRDEDWSAGYGETVTVEGLPLVATWGGGSFTARAAARIGRLMLREGNWEGERILSAEAVRGVTIDPGAPPDAKQKWLGKQTGSAAIGWWRNTGGEVPSLPRDAYWGAGAGHQITLVIPSMRLIAVRNGQTLAGGDYDEARNQFFFRPLIEALGSPKR